jgi:uncharacterized protein (TIGR02231 family)
LTITLIPTISLVLGALLPGWAWAAAIEAPSRLVAATVYLDRATLSREAVVEVPAGAGVVVFRGLPADLLPDSLRAEGQGGGRVIFGALSHRLASQSELVAPREQELTAAIEQLQDQRQGVEAQRLALAAQRAFIENIGDTAQQRLAETLAELRLNPGEWAQAAQVIGRSLAEILQQDLAQQIALRELDRRLRALQEELAHLQTGQRQSHVVRLPLEADQATRLTIRLHYQVPGVSWHPVYDARLDTASAQLDLVQYGAVRQRTGEDWQDIRLVLSTAQPQQGAALPDLPPLWVDFQAPLRKTAEKRLMMEAAPPFAATADMMMAPGGNQQEAGFADAEIRNAGLVTEYVIPGPVSIKADGSESKVLCATFTTQNRLEVQVKPQLSTHAFLVSRVVVKGESVLLPGPASLFRDGAYVGTVAVPLLRPGQEQEIGFGIDDRVSVSRHVLHDERSGPGLLARHNQLERHLATVVKNQGPRPVDLVVLETIPAPRQDRIKVDILREATTGTYQKDVNDVKGLLRWSVPLAAGAESRITLGWRLSWPADEQLSGL